MPCSDSIMLLNSLNGNMESNCVTDLKLPNSNASNTNSTKMKSTNHSREKGKVQVKNDISSRGIQFLKTKLCPFIDRGVCTNAQTCRYAHNEDELRHLPDLKCTKLCETFLKGEICVNKNCPFAHSREDLRSSHVAFFKVTLCNFYRKGKCLNGSSCRFAHGTTELRNDTVSKSEKQKSKYNWYSSSPLNVQSSISEENNDITNYCDELTISTTSNSITHEGCYKGIREDVLRKSNFSNEAEQWEDHKCIDFSELNLNDINKNTNTSNSTSSTSIVSQFSPCSNHTCLPTNKKKPPLIISLSSLKSNSPKNQMTTDSKSAKFTSNLSNQNIIKHPAKIPPPPSTQNNTPESNLKQATGLKFHKDFPPPPAEKSLSRHASNDSIWSVDRGFTTTQDSSQKSHVNTFTGATKSVLSDVFSGYNVGKEPIPKFLEWQLYTASQLFRNKNELNGLWNLCLTTPYED